MPVVHSYVCYWEEAESLLELRKEGTGANSIVKKPALIIRQE